MTLEKHDQQDAYNNQLLLNTLKEHRKNRHTEQFSSVASCLLCTKVSSNENLNSIFLQHQWIWRIIHSKGWQVRILTGTPNTIVNPWTSWAPFQGSFHLWQLLTDNTWQINMACATLLLHNTYPQTHLFTKTWVRLSRILISNIRKSNFQAM